MRNSEQDDIWKGIKNTWNEQLQSEKISIQVSQLIDEFRQKVGRFESDSVNSDIATLKVNWDNVKSNKVSQFEKVSIKKDIKFISEFIRKIVARFK